MFCTQLPPVLTEKLALVGGGGIDVRARVVASFPGPAQLFVASIVTESWAGPGNEAKRVALGLYIANGILIILVLFLPLFFNS